MRNFVSDFGKWTNLFENEGLGYSSIEEKIADLRHLAELGLISINDLRSVIRKEKTETIIESLPEIQEILNSPEYAEFQRLGLELVSSKTQILNGNIRIGYPGYDYNTDYALGFFKGVQRVKRMTPKGIPLGVWGRRLGSMDILIKDFKNIPSNKFYQVAMRWALDHIDFENKEFPVKRRTRKGYFDRD